MMKSDNWTFDPTCDSIRDTSDPFVSLSNSFYMVTSTVCVFVGLLGNGLSVSVFSAPQMRCVSSNVHLLALALSDGLYLATVFLGKTLTFLKCFGYVPASADVVNSSRFACVFLQYLSDLLADFSTCLILAFTVERWVAVYLPTRWKALCTVPRARRTTAGVFAVVALLICPHHVLFIDLYRDPDICAVVERYESLFTGVYVVEMLCFRILPVTAIAILNVFIIVRIGRIARKKNRMKKNADKNDHMQTTAMLTAVSSTYIALHTPVLVHFVVTRMYRSGLLDLSLRTIFLTQNYTRSMYLAAFAVNFFLYTVSGTVFRRQLLLTLRCRSNDVNTVSGSRDHQRHRLTQSTM